MKNSQGKRFFAVLPLVVVLAASWFCVRERVAEATVAANSDAKVALGQGAALPAPGTPLKVTIAELRTRAGAGDAAAASRLFEDLKTCEESWWIENVYAKSAQAALNRQADAGVAQAAGAAGAYVQQKLAFAMSSATLCAGVGDAEFSTIIPATLAAAQLGDLRAIDCYVARGFIGRGLWHGLLEHPDWIADYKESVVPLAQLAVKSGDWNVVRRLQQAYSGKSLAFDINLLNQATGTDPVQAYRYLKLQQLGASGSADMQGSLTEAASTIGPEAQRDADAWAQQTYQQYLHAAPKTGPDLMTCGV